MGFQISRRDPGCTVQCDPSGESHFGWLSTSCDSHSNPVSVTAALTLTAPPVTAAPSFLFDCFSCVLVWSRVYRYIQLAHENLEKSNASQVLGKYRDFVCLHVLNIVWDDSTNTRKKSRYYQLITLKA